MGGSCIVDDMSIFTCLHITYVEGPLVMANAAKNTAWRKQGKCRLYSGNVEVPVRKHPKRWAILSFIGRGFIGCGKFAGAVNDWLLR